MKLSHKISKIFNSDAYYSAKATVMRLPYQLDYRPFVEAIDATGFAEIKKKYYTKNDLDAPIKYLKLNDWIRTNTIRVRELRIRKAPPKMRIFDIGSGTGYFLHICKCLGHDVLGMDIDREVIYEETFKLMGLPRIIHCIKPYQTLPDTGAPFDLITAHMTCFNFYEDGSPWGIPEWEFFLKDLFSRLTPTGKVQFDLNVLRDGRHMTPELKAYFQSLRAHIDRRRVFLMPPR